MTGWRGGASRRLLVRMSIGAALLVALFVVVTSLYDAEGQLVMEGGSEDSTGVIVGITPVSVETVTSTATVRVAILRVAEQYLDDGGRLGQGTRLTVITDTGIVEERFPAGTVPGAVEIEAGLDGDVALYPFDDYQGPVVVVVDEYTTAADGSITSLDVLPSTIVGGSGVSGWHATLTSPTSAEDEPESTLTFTRAFSTQAFALLILSLSVILAVLSISVGLLVRLRRRVIEATMLSWFAALLFALPALRNFMPGSPPIGVALDVYVFLWVMVCAVFGVVLAVLAWIDRDRDRPAA